MKLGRWFLLTLGLPVLGMTLIAAQRFGQSGGRFSVFDNLAFGFFDRNKPPDTEFILARWHYTAGWGGGGWAHDYPTAEEHILQIMKEATGINVERVSYRVVELGSPEIFNYPVQLRVGTS